MTMEPSLSSLLLLSLAAPLAYGDTTTSSTGTSSITSTARPTSSSNPEDNVTITSVITGSAGPTTRIETFVPTTYSELEDLTSTITTTTVVTVKHASSSSSVKTYSIEVGPGGVAWSLPTVTGDDFPLPPPTFLPGEKPSSTSSSKVGSSTSSSTSGRSSESASSGTGSSSRGSSAQSSSQTTEATSSTSRQGESTSRQTTSRQTSSQVSGSSVESSSHVPQPTSTGTKGQSSSSSGSSNIPSSSNVPVPSGSSSSSSLPPSSSSRSLSSTSERTSGTSSHVPETSGPKPPSSGPTIAPPPPTTSPGAVITATITAPPAGFSAETLKGITFPSNTWTTTEKDGETTIVPIIIFGGGPPIIMWNFPPTPNVQFSFPGLPKFHLPCIKIFGIEVGSCTKDPVTDGPPEDNPDDPTTKPTDKPTTSKDDECTTSSTVSDCEVRCATTTTSNSCVSHTTSCSETKTGCDVTGTTKTISSTTSACTTCSSCMPRGEAGNGGPPVPTYPPVRPDDVEEADELRRRDHPRHLQKRAGGPSEVSTLSACSLTTGTLPRLTRPSWPKATGDILNPDAAGKMKNKFSSMSRYDRATGTGPCGTVPTVTRIDAKAFQVASNYKALNGKTIADNDRLSLDHAYEKSWIRDFLESLMGATTGGGKLNCFDTNVFFFPQAVAPATCQWSLLQPVWNSIASGANPQYFIAMSQYVNGDGKGYFFADKVAPIKQEYITNPAYKIANDATKWHWATGKSGSTTSAFDTLKTMINVGFERTVLGCVEMKMAPMLELMDKTNNRIYDELLLIDARITAPANVALFGGPANITKWTTTFGTGGIAEAYKNYMTTNMQQQINVPPQYLTKLWNFIKDGIKEAENLPDVKTDSKDNTKPGKYLTQWQEIKTFADNVDSVYLKSGTYDWEYSFTFGWNRANKRQESDDDTPVESNRDIELVCSKNPSSSSSSRSASATSSENSSRTSQPSQTTSTGSSSRSDSSQSSSGSQTSSSVTSSGSRTSSGLASSKTSGMTTSSRRSTTTTSSRTSSKTTTTTTTTKARVTAPAVTIGTSTEKVEKCEQGYGTHSMMAKATAPANAKSQRFFVPRADFISGGEWSIEFIAGFVGDDPKKFDKNKPTDPKTVVAEWSVGVKDGKALVAKGKGGKDMQIKWKTPDKATGVYVELVYVDPVGQQEWGIVVKGGRAACMPDSCNGPPRVVSDDNGKVCKKWPCSTQIVCEDSGPITPRADCMVIEDGVIVPMWYEVSIVTNNFVQDGGAKLQSEEKGCGAMTAWNKRNINIRAKDGSWTALYEFTFTLPIFIGAGCVERAIASAGGPKDLRCLNGQSDWVFIKRDADEYGMIANGTATAGDL